MKGLEEPHTKSSIFWTTLSNLGCCLQALWESHFSGRAWRIRDGLMKALQACSSRFLVDECLGVEEETVFENFLGPMWILLAYSVAGQRQFFENLCPKFAKRKLSGKIFSEYNCDTSTKFIVPLQAVHPCGDRNRILISSAAQIHSHLQSLFRVTLSKPVIKFARDDCANWTLWSTLHYLAIQSNLINLRCSPGWHESRVKFLRARDA